MEDIIKWGLIGAAAWFVLDRMGVFSGTSVLPTVSQPSVSNLPSTTTTQQSAPPSQSTGSSSVASKGLPTITPQLILNMANLSGGASTLSFDQWNYYMQKADPTQPVVSWENTDAGKYDRGKQWNIGEWTSLVTTNVKGMGNLYDSNQYLEGIRIGSLGNWERLTPFIKFVS